MIIFNKLYFSDIIIIIFLDPTGLLIISIAPAIDTNPPRKTKDNLVWTAGTGDPIYEVCIQHRIPRA